VPRVDSPLGFIASWMAIPLKGAVDEAPDSIDAIDLVDGFFIDSQPLICELRAPC
jgi:hypothetical protein